MSAARIVEPVQELDRQEVLTRGLDALRVGLALFDQSDRLVHCNDHFRFIYKSFDTVGDLLGLRFVDLVRLLVDNAEIAGGAVIEDPEAWIERRLRAHNNPNGAPFEEQLTDGRWIQIKERPIPGLGVIGLWQDISTLKVSHLRIADALESAADGLALWDQSDRLILQNRHFAGLFEDSGEVPQPGEAFAGLLEKIEQHRLLDDHMERHGRLGAWRKSHREVCGRCVLRHSNGRWYLIRERRTREGGVASVLTDVTDLKSREQELILRGKSLERTVDELEMVQVKLEEQGGELVSIAEELSLAKEAVEQADASKTRFLRSISHELRTPLNAIIGFAEILREELLGAIGNRRYREYANDIFTSGNHLLALVNQLLDLTRIEAGRYHLELGSQRLQDIVNDAVRLVLPRIEKSGLLLESELDPELPTVVADEQVLRQILVNLLSNAAKFTPGEGDIRIRGTVEGTYMMVSVVDSGIGIPPERLPHLMRPFERVETDLDRHTEGTGLGLAISKSLAELHGGSLAINSTLGVGTTAVVKLPLAGPRPEQEPAEADPPRAFLSSRS